MKCSLKKVLFCLYLPIMFNVLAKTNRAVSTFPVPVCTVSPGHWVYKAIGLAGATRLTWSDFMLHLGRIYFYQIRADLRVGLSKLYDRYRGYLDWNLWFFSCKYLINDSKKRGSRALFQFSVLKYPFLWTFHERSDKFSYFTPKPWEQL